MRIDGERTLKCAHSRRPNAAILSHAKPTRTGQFRDSAPGAPGALGCAEVLKRLLRITLLECDIAEHKLTAGGLRVIRNGALCSRRSLFEQPQTALAIRQAQSKIATLTELHRR